MELYKNALCLNLNKIKIGSAEENWVFEKKIWSNTGESLIKAVVPGYLY